jgi:hypothetical protein
MAVFGKAWQKNLLQILTSFNEKFTVKNVGGMDSHYLVSKLDLSIESSKRYVRARKIIIN